MTVDTDHGEGCCCPECYLPPGCNCEACCNGPKHKSDCAVHNEPAYPNGPCTCGVGIHEQAIYNTGWKDATKRIAKHHE